MRGQHDRLGVHLGVGVDVAVDMHGVGLIHTVRELEAVGRHRGKVHEPADPGVDRRAQHPAGAQDVDVPGLFQRERRPQQRGGVDHGVRPLQPRRRGRPGLGTRDVTGDHVPCRIGRQIDTAYHGAEGAKPGRHGAADEAVGSGDEDRATGQRGRGTVEFVGAHSVSVRRRSFRGLC